MAVRPTHTSKKQSLKTNHFASVHQCHPNKKTAASHLDSVTPEINEGLCLIQCAEPAKKKNHTEMARHNTFKCPKQC